MNKELILKKTMKRISLLPDSRIKEISEYVDFLLNSNNDKNLTEEIMKLTSKSKSFEFLYDEEDIYNETDLIEDIND